MGVRMIVGDVRRALDEIPDGSVDMVWSSPPFFNVRSYLDADHPMKHLEIGTESTPAQYLETMLNLTEVLGRKLSPTGTLGIELGDSLAGSGGAGGDYNDGGLREGQNRFDGTARKAARTGVDSRRRATRIADSKARGKPDGGSWSNRQLDTQLGIRPREVRWKGTRDGFPLDKSHIGIPTLYTWSLAYGRNLLAEPFTAVELLDWIDQLCTQGWTAEQALAFTGGWVAEHQEDFRHSRTFEPWRIRNLAVWIRPNPSVGREGDKFRRSTSYITIACRARDRWFDLEAVLKPNPRWNEYSRNRSQLNRGAPGYHTGDDTSNALQNPRGAPPSDHFIMSPAQYTGSHYAVMPQQLCDVPIEAMCPRRVCRTCKAPSRRIINVEPSPFTDKPGVDERRHGERSGVGPTGERHGDVTRESVFIGWSSCECADTGDLWAPGWKDVSAEIEATLTTMRRRDTSKAERELIRDEKLQPLYDQLAGMYHGRADGMHEGAGWRAGVVLDPFGGSGTTGLAAVSKGRDAILIDLDEDNVALVDERIGLFLDSVETVR